MTGIDAELLSRFRDDDTDTWIAAAIEMGEKGPAVLPELESYLSSEKDMHAHRHTWGVMAAVLSTHWDREIPRIPMVTRPGLAPERIEPRVWFKNLAQETVIAGLAAEGSATFGDLANLDVFVRKRDGRIAKARANADRAPEHAREAARDKADRQIAALRDPATPIRGSVLSLKGRLHFDPWSFGCFVACCTREFVEECLEIPATLWVRALSVLAAKKGGDRIAYVANLPTMFGDDLVDDERAAFVDLLVDRLPAPEQAWDHWATYCSRLSDWSNHGRNSWTGLVLDRAAESMPDFVAPAFRAWKEQPDEQNAMAVIQAAGQGFLDELAWREAPSQHRTCLAVYLFVMIHPGPTAARIPRGYRRFDLDHRIRVTSAAIETWKDRNGRILQLLVRLLRLLLREEVAQATSKRKPLVDLTRRQIYRVQPLIAQWNLRGTLPKDLASIVSRALGAMHISVEQHRDDRMEYRELLYTVLYALPEGRLNRRIEDLSGHPTVRAQFAALQDYLQLVSAPSPSLDRLRGAYARTAREMWDRRDFDADGLHARHLTSLVDGLCRRWSCRALSDEDQRTLAWVIRQRQAWLVDAEAGHPSEVNEDFHQEMSHEVASRTARLVKEISSTVQRIAALERVIEDGSESPDVVVEAFRDAQVQQRELQDLCRRHLPLAERGLAVLALDRGCDELQRKHEQLSRVIDGEDEALGCDLVHCQVRSRIGEPEKRLLANWMLGRYMMRELAGEAGWLVTALTSAWFVVAWIATPFVLTWWMMHIDLPSHRTTMEQWLHGGPFVLIILLNLVVLGVYSWGTHNKLPAGISRASLLVPQMVGTLLLGIVQAFSADESWSLAYMSNPLLKLVKLGLFLAASYFFVRYVMVGNQKPRFRGREPRVELKRTLRRRAIGLMSLGLWQSFAMITLFALFEGTVMSDETRAALPTTPDGVLPQMLERVAPHTMTLPLGEPPWLELSVFPWAILSWTVQLFFFSAIFERIMNRPR